MGVNNIINVNIVGDNNKIIISRIKKEIQLRKKGRFIRFADAKGNTLSLCPECGRLLHRSVAVAKKMGRQTRATGRERAFCTFCLCCDTKKVSVFRHLSLNGTMR